MAEGLLPCLDCKDYHKCPYSVGKQCYIYIEIRWCPYQVIYIIEHSAELIRGNWPDNPDGSGYTDPMIKLGYRSEAYFTKPEEIIAEVEYRLSTTGDAGDALVDEVLNGTVTIDRLSRPARLALMYAKGRDRKSETFPQWRAVKTYRGKAT